MIRGVLACERDDFDVLDGALEGVEQVELNSVVRDDEKVAEYRIDERECYQLLDLRVVEAKLLDRALFPLLYAENVDVFRRRLHCKRFARGIN